jgi:hypothetical protein
MRIIQEKEPCFHGCCLSDLIRHLLRHFLFNHIKLYTAMRGIFFVLLVLLSTIQLQAQDIMVDRKGNDVLLYYEAGSKQFKISSGDPSLQVSYALPLNSIRYYIDRNKNGTLDIGDDTTVTKSTAISFTGKLLSTDDYLFLSDIGKLKPGFQHFVPCHAKHGRKLMVFRDILKWTIRIFMILFPLKKGR